MAEIDPIEIIEYFYPKDDALRRLLLQHSSQVRDKALEILKNPALNNLAINPEVVKNGAMLHDIGIIQCNAPKIFCIGALPYIAHGVTGARMLREYGASHQLDLTIFSNICERHTGSGLSITEVRRQQLPIPEQDYLPISIEEKLICFADKFFSKSGDLQEKTLAQIQRSIGKFGIEATGRFDRLCSLFGF